MFFVFFWCVCVCVCVSVNSSSVEIRNTVNRLHLVFELKPQIAD